MISSVWVERGQFSGAAMQGGGTERRREARPLSSRVSLMFLTSSGDQSAVVIPATVASLTGIRVCRSLLASNARSIRAIRLMTQAEEAYGSCCSDKICATEIISKKSQWHWMMKWHCVDTVSWQMHLQHVSAVKLRLSPQLGCWKNQRLSVFCPPLGTKRCGDVSQMVGGEWLHSSSMLNEPPRGLFLFQMSQAHIQQKKTRVFNHHCCRMIM